MNVLVTGVGAIIGYGIINSLRVSKYDTYIYGMDIYQDAYGKEICDEFIQAIPAADPMYLEFLKNILIEKKIDLLFFGTEQEIYRVYPEREFFDEWYKKIVINNQAILELSQDKWKTYEFQMEHGIQAIPSFIEGSYQELKEKLGSPFLLKPRSSYASKGIQKIESEEDFSFYKKKAGAQFMVQKIIGNINTEYTASIFGFGDGTATKPIILKRKLSLEGATAKAQVVDSIDIVNKINKMVAILKPIGPTNFQFRVDQENAYLLETNPRISSATSIRTSFGYNEAEMCLEYFALGKKPDDPNITYGSAVRYIADRIITK